MFAFCFTAVPSVWFFRTARTAAARLRRYTSMVITFLD